MLCVVCAVDSIYARLLFSLLFFLFPSKMCGVWEHASGKMLKPVLFFRKFKWENWKKWDESRILLSFAPHTPRISYNLSHITSVSDSLAFSEKLSNKIWKITLSSASTPLILSGTLSVRARMRQKLLNISIVVVSCVFVRMCKWNKKQRKISSLLHATHQAYLCRLSFETFYASLQPSNHFPLVPLALKQQQFRGIFFSLCLPILW